MAVIDVQRGDILRSNNGAGPLLAEVVSVRSDRVQLVRWNEDTGKSRVYFTLPLHFLSTEWCGWVRIKP